MLTHCLIQHTQPNIVVESHGDRSKPMILFIHGFSQSRKVWKKQLNSALAHDYHLVAMDLRGHGDSDKPNGCYHHDQAWANDIKMVIDFFSPKAILLCAWSYGAMITCDFLKYYQDNRIIGINFVAPFVNNGAPKDELIIHENMLGIFTELCSETEDITKAATKKFIEKLTSSDLSSADFDYFFSFNIQCPYYVRADLLTRQAFNNDLLQQLQVPVLISHGMQDNIVMPLATQLLMQLIKTADVSYFDGIGHSPFWEASHRFNKELIYFSKKCIKDVDG